MLGAKEILKEAESLPVEERTIIIYRLLRFLYAPSPEIDKTWINTAKHRLSELRSGKVKAIPGDEVFARVKEYVL
ncbi:MAG: addiction module protein [Candidatus Fermentibacteraceae bacterium]|nr:addiction module protein [Candidatus Fermentibacteraceae bacterium]